MVRRLLVLTALTALALALAASALAATITVRVEGKTRSIFGSLPVTVEASNAMQALDIASTLGEFHYQVVDSSFGPYVSQIGKYPAAGASGWVFKVNGASPPVGADKVELKDGDAVLWYFATFGDLGGPATLDLKAAGAGCYALSALDDAGKKVALRSASLHVDGRRVKVPAGGKACVGRHTGLVRAFAVGAVRSNAVR